MQPFDSMGRPIAASKGVFLQKSEPHFGIPRDPARCAFRLDPRFSSDERRDDCTWSETRAFYQRKMQLSQTRLNQVAQNGRPRCTEQGTWGPTQTEGLVCNPSHWSLSNRSGHPFISRNPSQSSESGTNSSRTVPSQRWSRHFHTLSSSTQSSAGLPSCYNGDPRVHVLVERRYVRPNVPVQLLRWGNERLPFPRGLTKEQQGNQSAKVAEFQHGEKTKRARSPISPPPVAHYKKVKGFDKLDLLCAATLDVGPLQENPSGCSCPKSKCIALYCDCFKAGRRCNTAVCTCLDCKNTVAESGKDGARTKAIRCILARNPRAFTSAGIGNLKVKQEGEIACNCIRSRCLKLYCTCFQQRKACDPKMCTCVSCLNTEADPEGFREQAIRLCLEKRPDAFQMRVRTPGLGCACKNNKCIRKYCECFRNGLDCNADKCSCLGCENRKL